MIESRCGILCSECGYREKTGCKGCVNIDKPFWGKECKVKKCCEEKSNGHCGECGIFACKKLKDFAFDAEQGDNGKRIEQCKIWRQDGKPIAERLEEKRFDYVFIENKDFIIALDKEMEKLGYDHGGNIGSGFCWGPHMVIYSKSGTKSKKVAARIYLRKGGIVLRLFLNDIDAHRGYIEKSAPHIKEPFVNAFGRCRHCKDDGSGNCKFRKSYTLDGETVEKCTGETFEFWQPTKEKLPDYIGLLEEFYGKRK